MNFKFAPFKHSQISIDLEFWRFCTKYKAYSMLWNTPEIEQSTLTKVIIKMLWKARKNARSKQDNDRAVSANEESQSQDAASSTFFY